MKHIVIYFYGFLTVILCCPACAQTDAWKVSSTPTPAHILIEEFTGLHCSYCPQAHTISNNLTYVAGEQVHVMAVHTGSLAAPVRNEPDFRTPYGEVLFGWQGEGGMPSGNINRTAYPECLGNNYSLYRSEWAAVAKKLLTDQTPAPLNLYAEAHLDAANDVISITVEAYSTENANRPLCLNVALTENFIPGVQAGSSISPYYHRHVLRDFITGLEGDTLKADETVQGAYLRRTYSYKLPAQYNDLAPNRANLACLVFVTDTNRAVLNSFETPVANEAKVQLDYLQINLYGLDKVYGGPVYDVYILNPSHDTVRSLEFSFDLDGDTRIYPLSGLALPPKTESIVRLTTDFDADKFQKTNVYTLRLLKANGQEIKANMVKNSFNAPLTLPSASFRVSFTSDTFGSENIVILTDNQGKTLYKAGPFANGESRVYTSDLIEALPGQVYALHVSDAFRDGVQETDPTGHSLKILTATDSVLYQSHVGVYGHAVSFRLPKDTSVSIEQVLRNGNEFRANLCPNPANEQTVLQIEDLEPEAEVCVSIYNLQGQLRGAVSRYPQASVLTVPLMVSDYPQGMYLVRITQNSRQQVIKIVVLR